MRTPSPATVIAVIAFVFALAGGAFAASSNKAGAGPVSVATTTGHATFTGNSGGPIPLGSSTFTQKAGQAVLVADEGQLTGPAGVDQTCDVGVNIFGTRPDGQRVLALNFADLARRGDETSRLGDSQALPAPASDRVITLAAEGGVSDSGQAEFTCLDDETWTVSLRVSVVGMPG